MGSTFRILGLLSAKLVPQLMTCSQFPVFLFEFALAVLHRRSEAMSAELDLCPPEPSGSPRTNPRGPMASLNDLPDLVLLEILSLLPVRERVRNARVCRRWKSLVHDPLMWRHADLRLREVQFKIIWYVLRRYIKFNLQSLYLQGYVQSHPRCRSTLHSIPPEFFKVLGKKCPHLQRLSIRLAELVSIPMASLPRTLRRLEIHSCDIWIDCKEDEGALPHLEQLVLDHMPTFQDHYLRRLTCFPTLRSLILCGTYWISQEGLDRGLRELSHLQRIEVLGSLISTDSVLQAISRHLRDVRHIRVTVGTLTATGLEALEGLPKLASLSLLSTCSTGEMCLIPFAALLSSCLTLPRLRVLELQGQGWEGQEAEAMLKKELPHCRVIVGALPPQTTDWWRFIRNPKYSNKFSLDCLSSPWFGNRDKWITGFLKVLFQYSPHLHRLNRHMAHLLLIPMASLPRILCYLEMTDVTSLVWMAHEEEDGALPHLEQLVLDHVHLKIVWHVLHHCIGSRLQWLLLKDYQVSSTSVFMMLLDLFKVLGQKCSHLQCMSLHTAHLHGQPAPLLAPTGDAQL
ncbi:LOW QUALITY PROTEIN: F-box/LRR-repeat protein 12-like [Suncus etruscus]|uniref:LOW QUALITY PROTEIN: F-box/LRR-repeat protein 12-like n=1 Tax=Suncus etruscus TaxID=109475 RepID=UPI002110DF9D|nr:LOW QUALITY PROTEIN: F-box/LRR-repeat protein 12-like [Suncus etruscus]